MRTLRLPQANDAPDGLTGCLRQNGNLLARDYGRRSALERVSATYCSI